MGAAHQLIVLTVLLPSAGPVILEDPRRKLWGFNDGAVPAIIKGYLRRLDNDTDELGELIKTILRGKAQSVVPCTIWSTAVRCWCTYLVDHSVTLPGFKTSCVDRDINLSG